MKKIDIKSLLSDKKKLAWAIFILLCALYPTMMKTFGSTYLITIGCYLEIYIISISGMDILTGYCGQVSMGHAAFYAIGAYTSAILTTTCGVPVLISMLCGAILSSVIGALIAFPCSSLQFHFLALATTAFVNVVQQIAQHSPGGITGNYNGYFTSGVDIFGYPINTYSKYYYFGFVCTVIFIIFKQKVVNSKIGRAMTAIRDNVKAANGMGIDVKKYKVIAFAISAFYMGFGGAMLAHLVQYIAPTTFSAKQSVIFLMMLLLGGQASVVGTIVGCLAITVITESIRSFPAYQVLVMGAILLFVILVMPSGLVNTFKGLYAKYKLKKAAKKEEKA